MLINHFQLIGSKTKQEDAFYISSDNRMIAVCDGVGGHVNGEMASNVIIESIKHQYESYSQGEAAIDISEMVMIAANSLNDCAILNPDLIGSSTTLAILFFQDDNNAVVTHIGDSRVLLLRKSEEEYWSTKDHSIVQELYDAGILKTEDQMRTHPYNNRITRAITAGKEITNDLSIQKIPYEDDRDCFIVCSDGLLENYTNNDLQKLYRENTMAYMVDVIKAKCEQFSKDNTTVVVIGNGSAG